MTRLVVAADFDVKGSSQQEVRRQIRQLARDIAGLPVQIKLNSGLRALGLSIAREVVAGGGEPIFADWKLNDISETLGHDGRFLLDNGHVQSVTVMCSSNVAAMRALCREIQPAGIKVIGVTVFTSWNDDDCRRVYGCAVAEAAERLALLAVEAGLDGLVASGKELPMLQALDLGNLGNMSFEVPAIRPTWSLVAGDDQKRVVTPTEAVRLGASSIIVGRPIVQAKPNNEGRPQSRREAVEWTLKEMNSAN